LATLMPGSGDPFCSLVNVATDVAGAPLMLLSTLAIHTKNILADNRVSLLLDERKAGDPLEGARVMLMGSCSKNADSSAASSYLRRHPEAEQYASFGDFAFYRMDIKRAHLVAGFGRIVDLSAQELLTDISDAQELIDAEAGAIAHMNADHAEACRLYATKLLGVPDGDWRCVGIDPEGIELQQGRTALRLPFPQRVTAPSRRGRFRR
jgi:putative heme iron utilization protein